MKSLEDHYLDWFLLFFKSGFLYLKIRSTTPSGNGPSEDRKSFRGDSKKLLKGVKSFTKSVYKDAKTKFH